MSNNISANVLKKFILENVGSQLTKREARELNITKEYNDVAEELDENYIDVDDIMDSNLYENFATLYVAEMEKKQVAKDKDAEKEENRIIKNEKKSGF